MKETLTPSLFRLTIIATIGLSLSGLIAYLPGFGALGSVDLEYIPMAPSTAISFIVLSISLYFQTKKLQLLNNLSKFVLLFFSFFVSAFGLLDIIGYYVDKDLNFEDSIFPDMGLLHNIPIARMSPSTGALFCIFGLALIFLILTISNNKRLSSRVGQLSGIVSTLGIIASTTFLLGYLYGTPLLYNQKTIPMALTTSLGFCFLGIGLIISLGSDFFPLNLFFTSSTQSLIARIFIPLISVALLVQGVLSKTLDVFFKLNDAIYSSTIVVLFILIAGVITNRLSKRIGNAIDKAEKLRETAEKQTKETQILLKSSIESPRDMIILAIDKNYKYLHFNDAHKISMLHAYNRTVDIGMSILDCISNDQDKNQLKSNYDRALAGESYNEIRVYGEQQKSYYETLFNPIINEDKEIIGVTAFAMDITDRKQAEEQIKASLKEKETLLHEVHHRVKNNMQVINSLLKLQSNNIEDQHVKNILKDSQNRVYAMSAVHETLHGSERLSEIDVKSYLTKITTSVFQTYSTDHRKVKLNSNVEDSLININKAYPLGLIINELISNSLKYAFPKEKEGEISVTMKRLDKELELIVMDNGIGMPDKLDWKNSSTLGLKLVRTLVENQLDGSIDMESNNGTKFTIKFNVET